MGHVSQAEQARRSATHKASVLAEAAAIMKSHGAYSSAQTAAYWSNHYRAESEK